MPKMNSCFGRSTDPIDTDGRVKRLSAFFNTRKTDIILSLMTCPQLAQLRNWPGLDQNIGLGVYQ